ncbi:unnamed protein product [Adineta ricciae]|uniref:G-protein coupled receptors family 1 profile domain-containing protein n=1 Tax=Adineta ricciae TaxID=249248 RepID=A0A815YLM1_ADIRI|nr:unnamed protein product [Adineta ricciae]CAF1571265.1 unnamed protein product [Adineta ricciae]
MKRSLTNRLIVHVACCDLIILLLNLPDLIQFVSSINGNWFLSEFSCKLIRSILVFAQYASVLTMCAITIERFIGIVYPLRSKFLGEKKRLRYVTFLVWLFSFVCASPNLIYLRVISYSSTHRSCSLLYSRNFLNNQRYYIIHKALESTIFYFIPLFLQLYCYSRIATKLFHVDQTLQSSLPLNTIPNYQRTQEDLDDEDDEIVPNRVTRTDSYVRSPMNVKSKNLLPKLVSSLDVSELSITKKYNEDKHWQIYSNTLKSRRNVIKMLIVVIVIYFISFSPQVLVFLLFQTNAIRRVPQFIQTPYFMALTMLLITISSASNPIVYAIFCFKFRQSFQNLLRQFCFWKRFKLNCHFNRRQTSNEIKTKTRLVLT